MFGKSDVEIKALWRANGDNARDLGTLLHGAFRTRLVLPPSLTHTPTSLSLLIAPLVQSIHSPSKS
jgi:hypothetical protein